MGKERAYRIQDFGRDPAVRRDVMAVAEDLHPDWRDAGGPGRLEHAVDEAAERGLDGVDRQEHGVDGPALDGLGEHGRVMVARDPDLLDEPRLLRLEKGAGAPRWAPRSRGARAAS